MIWVRMMREFFKDLVPGCIGMRQWRESGSALKGVLTGLYAESIVTGTPLLVAYLGLATGLPRTGAGIGTFAYVLHRLLEEPNRW